MNQEATVVLKKIGNNIRKERVKQNVTMKDIATKLQLTTQAYGNIENGKTDFGVSRLFEISSFLKISFTQLLMVDKSMVYNIHVENNTGVAYLQHADVFNNMDFEEIKKMVEFIEAMKKKK
ncbi:MAG: Helix-turn-helix domain [Bacteroidota bacterium]|jgi:transcriptional regulator with XRE-family HTH domain